MKTYIRPCRWGDFMLIEGDMISDYVARYGEWVETEIDLFRSLLPEDGVVSEVGSNIGMHTVPLAKHCKFGEVIAYEPQRPIYYVLAGNLALNNCLNVTAQHVAVMHQGGTLQIETSDYDTPWNYGNFSVTAGFSDEREFPGATRREPVRSIALDEDPHVLRLSRLDMLKIDAEGAEPDILKGAHKIIRQHLPFNYVEGTKPDVTQQVDECLGRLGYLGFWFIAVRTRPDSFNGPPSPDDGLALRLEKNMIFVPANRTNVLHGLTPINGDTSPPRGIPALERYPHPADEPFAYST